MLSSIYINDDQKLCYIDENPISLSKNEYSLLKFLLQNTNKIFSREELIENVWDKRVSDRTVDVTISRLRSKIGRYRKSIQTRGGFGYGFFE